jgi:hypothetical protein
MTYSRLVGRNRLNGPGYAHTDPKTGLVDVSPEEVVRSMIRGDMRRMEQDQRDEHHLKLYAEHAGITVEQARAVLDLFFKEDYNGNQKFTDP